MSIVLQRCGLRIQIDHTDGKPITAGHEPHLSDAREVARQMASHLRTEVRG